MVTLDRITAALLDEFATAFPDRRLLGAWLFGSRAREECRTESDVDVAVLCDRALEPVALFDAGCRLAATIGKAVDLVDLRRVGGLLRVEATHHGRPLVPSTIDADLFATHALADHAAFAPNRRMATRAFEEKLHAR